MGTATWQILLMLFVAFLLGMLLRHLFGGGGKYKAEAGELRASNKRLRDELDHFKKRAPDVDQLSGVRAELDAVRSNNRELQKSLLAAQSTAASTPAADGSAEVEALKRTNDKLNAELEDCRKRASSTGAVTATPAAAYATTSAPVSATKPASPDDLTKIEGVGKKIQEHLNNGGVWSFDQLSGTAVERLQEILDKAGPAYTMHAPGTWPEQAVLARDGHWEKLEKWQSELKGGRKRKKR